MSNPFFNNTIDLLPFTKAKSVDVESNLSAVGAGFDEVNEYFSRSLRGARSGAIMSEMPGATARASKVLGFDSSGNPIAVQPDTVQDAVARSGDTMTGGLTVPNLNGGHLAGHRNKLLNPFTVNQRAATSASDDQYCLDAWYVLTESGSVTISNPKDLSVDYQPSIRLTQPDASPKRIGIAQIIESEDIRPFANSIMNISANIDGSAGVVGLKIRYAVLSTNGTPDVVTSDVVNNWSSTSFTAGGFFIAGVDVLTTGFVTIGTEGFLSKALSMPGLSLGAISNAIVFFWSETAVPQNEYIQFSLPQFEPGAVRTPCEFRLNELSLCQRRYFRHKAEATNDILAPIGHIISATQARVVTPFPVPMRVAPTALEQSGAAADYRFVSSGTTAVTCTSVPSFVIASRFNAMSLLTYSTAGLTADRYTYGSAANTNAFLGWSADL